MKKFLYRQKRVSNIRFYVTHKIRGVKKGKKKFFWRVLVNVKKAQNIFIFDSIMLFMKCVSKGEKKAKDERKRRKTNFYLR